MIDTPSASIADSPRDLVLVRKLFSRLYWKKISIKVLILCQNRYLQGLKTEGGEHSFLSEPSGCKRGLQKDSQLDNAWSLKLSRGSSFPTEKSTDDSTLKNDYPQHSFFSSDFTTGEPVKHEGQSLRPFFDEWPEDQDIWSGLKDNRSNSTSFSTTKLSMSIPIASSGFSTSSRSPQGGFFLLR
jgi:hypothetical protein